MGQDLVQQYALQLVPQLCGALAHVDTARPPDAVEQLETMLRVTALLAVTHALQVLDYGPGRNHDLVEVGTDSVFVDFDEAVTACEDQPSAAICVYQNGKDRSCGDGAPEADAKRGVVKLPNELKQFDSRYDIAIARKASSAP